jgi:hypothetical protein
MGVQCPVEDTRYCVDLIIPHRCWGVNLVERQKAEGRRQKAVDELLPSAFSSTDPTF